MKRFFVYSRTYAMGSDDEGAELAFIVTARDAEEVQAGLCGVGLSRPDECWTVRECDVQFVAGYLLKEAAQDYMRQRDFKPNKKKWHEEQKEGVVTPWPTKGLRPGEATVIMSTEKIGRTTLSYGWCDFCHLANSLLHPEKVKGKQACLACHKKEKR